MRLHRYFIRITQHYICTVRIIFSAYILCSVRGESLIALASQTFTYRKVNYTLATTKNDSKKRQVIIFIYLDKIIRHPEPTTGADNFY
jgi:hypothetical protein